MGDFDRFTSRWLDSVRPFGQAFETIVELAKDTISNAPSDGDCYQERRPFPWEDRKCDAANPSPDMEDAIDDRSSEDELALDSSSDESLWDRWYHGAGDALERGYDYFYNGSGKPYNPLILENWDRMPYLGIKVFFATALGGGNEGPTAKVDDQDFSIHARKGALVVNGKAWKLRGNSLKIRLGSDISIQDAEYILGKGLRLKVTVKVPDMFVDKVPESLRANINNPDNPIDRLIPEEQLAPILKALSSGDEHPVIPQLQGYPLEVVPA